MKNFKRLVTVILAVVMVLSLVACGSGEVKDPVDGELYPEGKTWDSMAAKYDKAVEITMWIPNSATSTMGKAIQALADKFNAEQESAHPGKNIKVVVEFQGTSGALNSKLQAAILAENNPVLSAVGVSSVPLYESAAVDLRNVFTYKELQSLTQGLLQYSLYNDKLMLNPYFPSASNILVYNKTLLESKGVTIPNVDDIINNPDKSDWTWENFKAACKKITDVDAGVYGFATASLDPIGMMYQQGGSLYNKTVTDIAFKEDDKFANGLEFWRSLVTENCMLNPTTRANHNSIIVSEFNTQKVGMIFTTSSNIVKFTDEANKAGFEIGVLPFPKVSQFFTNQGGSGIIILNNKPIEEQEAAAEFMRWINKPSSIATMCSISGYLPIDQAAMEEEELKAVYQATPLLKTAAQLMKFGVKSSQGKAKVAADKAVNEYAKEVWSQLDKPIATIVADTIDKVTFEIEANK